MKHKINKRINKKLSRLIRNFKGNNRMETMKDIVEKLRQLSKEYNISIITARAPNMKHPYKAEPVIVLGNSIKKIEDLSGTYTFKIEKNRSHPTLGLNPMPFYQLGSAEKVTESGQRVINELRLSNPELFQEIR